MMIFCHDITRIGCDCTIYKLIIVFVCLNKVETKMSIQLPHIFS